MKVENLLNGVEKNSVAISLMLNHNLTGLFSENKAIFFFHIFQLYMYARPYMRVNGCYTPEYKVIINWDIGGKIDKVLDY